MLTNRNILVTGGAGCIGSTLVEKLCENGNTVIIYDNLMRNEESRKNIKDINLKYNKNCQLITKDILNFNDLSDVVNEVEMVFHLAALPSHRRALEDPMAYAKVDVMGVVNVLEAIRMSQNKPLLVFTSSNKVYGKHQPPFIETMLPMPCGPYGMAKYNAEQWCQLYHEYYGLKVNVARLFHVIGPRTQPDREISIFTESILEDKEIFVHGIFDEQKKFISCAAGYTNVYDTIDGLILLMENCHAFDIYNIGSDKEITVEEIALMIYKKLDKKPKINYKEILSHESLRHRADNSKIKALGWRQNYSVEESVEQYIRWRIETGKRESVYV